MNKLHFAIVGAASLALAACGGQDDDTLDDAEINIQTDELNALAENAALEAETDELENQADELNAIVEEDVPDVDDNVTDPAVVEEDVQGM